MSDEIFQISVGIKGDDVKNAIERLRVGLKSADLMDRIGLQVASWGRARIMGREGTAPDGTRWPQLAASTLMRKRKMGKGHKGTLQLHDDLANSVIHANATEDSVEVGSASVYAMIHQKGGKTGRGGKTTIPARPYIGVSRDQEDQLRRFVERWIERLLENG